MMYFSPISFYRMALASVGLLSPICFAADDFSALKGHWNLDEGRDWHNMESSFSTPVSKAEDAVGSNDLIFNDKLDPVKSWVSGRQFSGIRFDARGQLLKSTTPLDELKGTATLSYWIKTDKKGGESPKSWLGITGDAEGIQWGAIDSAGKLVVLQGDKPVVETQNVVNDDRWHHIVVLRNADTGEVAIYVDGQMSGKGKGEAGEMPGSYLGFGAVKGGGSYSGVLDQIHLFDKPISPTLIQTLHKNHAPKAYPQDSLISSKAPSLTGSILHGLTFDPDQNKVGVTRFGQGRFGSVKYNNDGTFTYTPNKKGGNGRDSFTVTITDGQGGYCTTRMNVFDETTVPSIPVTKFANAEELPNVPEGEKKTGTRVPRIMDFDGDGRPDILVAANNRVWVYKNTGKKGAPGFAAPVEVKDADGKPLEATSIALLSSKKKDKPSLVVRNNEGVLTVYENKGSSKDGTQFAPGDKIMEESGSPFKCPSFAFDFGDYDNDGLVDLLFGDSGSGLFLHKNVGKSGAMKLKSEKEHILSTSYNAAPYFADLNNDGKMDLMHGINWGSIHFWLNDGGKKGIIADKSSEDILLSDKQGNIPMKGEGTLLRAMNGTMGATGDLNGDGVLDLVIGGYGGDFLVASYGVDPNMAAKNLDKIANLYRTYPRNLGEMLEKDGQQLLNKYKMLNREWIIWAINQPTVEGRERAYQDLKKHVAQFPFLQRKKLEDAWMKTDKNDGNKVVECGPMHHVPGIFVQNWVTLHCMKPDSAAHRLDVADAVGLKGLDRDRYLRSGLALADNKKCSEGQLMAIDDTMKYHPRVLFPDDHISIDRNMGDDRQAMSYVFKSNKNTFGNDVGGGACESAGDLRDAAEKYLGKDAATGDYFTLVMAHEVCHSLDAYVNGRANKDLPKRWAEMLVYAGNNGGETDVVVAGDDGWIDMGKTQERFREKKLWDGTSPWNDAWESYWKTCPYNDLTFMRGNMGWFLGAKQETLATQANHHWVNSEARLIGALDRYYRGYKANINEVVLYLDILSAGLNEVPMYRITVTQNPNRAVFKTEGAWLDRNDKGYIQRVTIGDREYDFDLDDRGKVIGMKSHPFMKEMKADTASK